MAVLKLSQISTSPSNLSSAAFLVGVTSAAVDLLYSPEQVTTLSSKITGIIPSSQGGTAVANSSAFSLTYTATVAVTITATAAINVTMPVSGTLLSNSLTNQLVSGGAVITATSLSTGNATLNFGACQLQYITNGSTAGFTITAPSTDGSMLLLIYNSSSAGTITWSGFSVGSNTGDPLTTTSSFKYTVSVWRINGTSGYRVAAHQ